MSSGISEASRCGSIRASGRPAKLLVIQEAGGTRSTIAEGPTPSGDDEVFDDPLFGYETPQFEPNGITFTAIELE